MRIIDWSSDVCSSDLGDLYGRRPLMLFGMGLFTLASLFCGLAQNMEQLVLARIFQGIGAGGMISVSQAIIGDIVPPRERGRYQGYFSSMYAVAGVAGPVLGGYMTERSEEHTSELQSLMRNSYSCFFLKKNT